jgi:hypothetical protein
MYAPLNNLFEQSGIGNYDPSGDWSWQFYPPPYDFLQPGDSVPMPPPVLGPGLEYRHAARLAPAVPPTGCGCGGTCGGCGGGHSHPANGLGLFDSADISTWGVGEWGVIGVGAYLLWSVFTDTKKVSRKVQGYRRKKKRKQDLLDEAASL